MTICTVEFDKISYPFCSLNISKSSERVEKHLFFSGNFGNFVTFFN